MTEAQASRGIALPMLAFVGTLAAAGLGAITLYTSGLGLLDPKLHRAGAFAPALLVAIWAARKHQPLPQGPRGWYVLALDLLLLAAGLWAIWSFYTVQSFMETALYDVRQRDVWPALAGIVVFLELCRRLWGWGLFSVGALAVVYLLVGQHLPGLLEHTGFTLREIATALWYNTNKGVFGSITNIVLTTVFIFIIFGALLEGTGAGDTLLKFAFLATRRTRGGPAHAAILASSLFGTMSGSTVANIVGTGTFTIPMIKKRGFSPAFAAGIEATASSGRRSWALRHWSWRTSRARAI